MHISPSVAGKQTNFLVSYIPSGSYNILPPFDHSSLSSEQRDLMSASHLDLTVPRSLTLCRLSSSSSHLLKEEASLMAEQGTDLQLEQNVIRMLLLLYFFYRTIIFCFTLGP